MTENVLLSQFDDLRDDFLLLFKEDGSYVIAWEENPEEPLYKGPFRVAAKNEFKRMVQERVELLEARLEEQAQRVAGKSRKELDQEMREYVNAELLRLLKEQDDGLGDYTESPVQP